MHLVAKPRASFDLTDGLMINTLNVNSGSSLEIDLS